MNQLYAGMPTLDLYTKIKGQIDLHISWFLRLGIKLKKLFRVQHITFGTGVIGRKNERLRRLLAYLQSTREGILQSEITTEKYNKFRVDVFNLYGKFYNQLVVLKFLYSRETKELADAIMEELSDLEFQMRKKAFPIEYRPNTETDKELMQAANYFSLTSAISCLEENEVQPR